MDQLSRSETNLILEGLDSVRERMRLAHQDSSDHHVLRDDPDYRSLLKLQVKLIEHLENLPY